MSDDSFEIKVDIFLRCLLVILCMATLLIDFLGVKHLPSAVLTATIFIKIFTIAIIIYDGTLLDSRKYLILLAVALIVIAIGVLAKIMHWAGANYILLSGGIGIIGAYTVRFLLKKDKILLDFLKCALVIVVFSQVIIFVLRIDVVMLYLIFLQPVVFMITLFAYLKYVFSFKNKID